jgi:hypothetical protein
LATSSIKNIQHVLGRVLLAMCGTLALEAKAWPSLAALELAAWMNNILHLRGSMLFAA